jgi:DNA modification methylase
MLRYFFSMFVDDNGRVLDPTCGSGSALRAADSLGAKDLLGLEVNSEYVKDARVALRKARNLRALNVAI